HVEVGRGLTADAHGDGVGAHPVRGTGAGDAVAADQDDVRRIAEHADRAARSRRIAVAAYDLDAGAAREVADHVVENLRGGEVGHRGHRSEKIDVDAASLG